jgi:hypothetical protein
MFTMIKASLFIACVIAVLEAVPAAAKEAGYRYNSWAMIYTADPEWVKEPEDVTEWLRKPEVVDLLGDSDYMAYDEDEGDFVPAFEIVGYVEVDTARLDTLDGYQVLDEDGHWDRGPTFDAERERTFSDPNWMTAHLEPAADYDDRESRWGLRS